MVIIMDLIGFAFVVAFIIGLIVSVIFILLGHEHGLPFSGLSIMFMSIILLCSGIFIVWFSFRIFLLRLNKSHFSLLKKISNRWDTSQTIVLRKKTKRAGNVIH